jgi:hypothetical protein
LVSNEFIQILDLVLNVILLYTEPALRICLLEQKKNPTPKEALRAIKVLHTLQENKKQQQQQQQPQLSL